MAFYDHAVTAVRGIYDRRIHTASILDTGHYFPAAARFTGAWQDIRREALAVAGMLPDIPRFHELMPEQADISANDGRDWRMFMMKVYGVPMKENLARCPTVAALLDKSPEVVSAVLSFLAPGKHIPAHRGPFRAILRYHLMLSMPSDAGGRPACELRIDGEPYLLGDGESLLWADVARADGRRQDVAQNARAELRGLRRPRVNLIAFCACSNRRAASRPRAGRGSGAAA